MSHRVEFAPEDFIVSRTDLRGIITYANRAFMDVAGYDESELLGRPHSIIRHPDMPRCVFQLLWDTIQTGQEIFAFVKNRCKNGDHYWVLAYVTADVNSTTRQIDGYYSVRRVPHDNALRQIEPIYQQLCAIEARASSKRDGIRQATQVLLDTLQSKGLTYEELIHRLQAGETLL
jgi:PAS domain S-box-containing protein